MVHGTFYSETLKRNVKQINITKARNLYNSGEAIFLQSSNMSFDSIWQPATKVGTLEDRIFDNIVNSFHYYNCDKERGNRVQFYTLLD